VVDSMSPPAIFGECAISLVISSVSARRLVSWAAIICKFVLHAPAVCRC
jgi:hypothetical protein